MAKKRDSRAAAGTVLTTSPLAGYGSNYTGIDEQNGFSALRWNNTSWDPGQLPSLKTNEDGDLPLMGMPLFLISVLLIDW